MCYVVCITDSNLAGKAGGASIAAPSSSSTPKTVIPPGAKYVDVPVSSIRAVIAKRLLESKITIPHYYLRMDINMDEVMFLKIVFFFNYIPKKILIYLDY